MKKVLLLIILLACIGWSGKAQNGASCATARPYNTDTSFVFPFKWQTKQQQWYQLTALTDTLDIAASDINMYSSSDKIIAIYLLKGNCGSTSLVASDTIDSSSDSLLTLTSALVIPDSNYYIMVLKQDTTSTINYSLGLHFRTPATCDTTATPCDYIFNGDFEYYQVFPPGSPFIGGSNVFDACPWTWGGLGGTPDYFSAGFTIPYNYGVPSNYIGYQNSISPGIAYAGIFAGVGSANFAEYILEPLKNGGLVPGNFYDISMWVSLAKDTFPMHTFSGGMAVNNIGFSFDTTGFWAPANYRLISHTPSLLYPWHIADTNWVHIVFNNYQAQGWEHYVTIGSFGNAGFSDSSICSTCFQKAYYFIDNVSIVPSAKPFTVTATSATCLGDSISLSTNSSQVVTWSSSPASTFSCSSCATTEATPSVTGATYYTAILSPFAGCILSDTVIVAVDSCSIGPCGILITDTTWNTGFSIPHQYVIYSLTHKVHVTGNVTLNRDVISISPNITITIDSNATLRLSNCHLYACDSMWKGIVVAPGGNLNIFSHNLIEDAITAVSITGPTTTTLNVSGAIFNKDSVGISIVNDIDTTASPYPFTITNAVFTCRNIPFTPTTWPSVVSLKILVNAGTTAEHYAMGNYRDTTLAVPDTNTRSAIGILLINVGNRTGTFPGPYTYNEMVIGDGNSNGALNVFDTLLYGIEALNSNLTCYNNAFQYILDPSTFGPTGYGIFSLYTTPWVTNEFWTENRLRVISDSANNIAGNRFYDCTVSIFSHYYNDVTVNHCDIRSTEESVTAQPSNGVVGVWVETPNCTQIAIDSNVITNEYLGVALFADDYASLPGYTDAQYIGPVHITDNTIQATYGTTPPTNEYCYMGIVAANNFDWYGAIAGTTTPLLLGCRLIPRGSASELKKSFN